MRWVKLSLADLPALRKQTAEVVEMIEQLSEQVQRPDVYSVRAIGTNCSLVLAKLLRACRARIRDMEGFYREHDLEPGVEAIETLRHRLNRAVLAGEAYVGDVEGGRATPRAGTPQITPRGGGAQSTRTGRRGAPSATGAAWRGRDYLEKGRGSLVWETASHRAGGHSLLRLRGAAGLMSETPWEDPAKFSYRPPHEPAKWITAKGFTSIMPSAPRRPLPHATKCTGPSAGPWRAARAEVVLSRTERPEREIDPDCRFTSIVGSCL